MKLAQVPATYAPMGICFARLVGMQCGAAAGELVLCCDDVPLSQPPTREEGTLARTRSHLLLLQARRQRTAILMM